MRDSRHLIGREQIVVSVGMRTREGAGEANYFPARSRFTPYVYHTPPKKCSVSDIPDTSRV